MRTVRRAAVSGLLALWLAPLPVLAGSQSSNSSSDCDNGRCRQVDSYFVEDRHGRRGWVQERHWREDDRRERRAFGGEVVRDRRMEGPRDRDDDDD